MIRASPFRTYRAPASAEQAGLEVIPIPVDAAGLDLTPLNASNAEAVILTPGHHFPSGAPFALSSASSTKAGGGN